MKITVQLVVCDDDDHKETLTDVVVLEKACQRIEEVGLTLAEAKALLGCVANFAQGIMKGQLVLCLEGLCREGVEQFGYREVPVSLLRHQLPFLEHVHQFDPHES